MATVLFNALRLRHELNKHIGVTTMHLRIHPLAAAAVLSMASLNASAAFDITINYTGDAAYQSYFTQAETFWESVITGYQSGISLTGMTISASIALDDGVGGTLGSAGPSSAVNQGGFVLTTTGQMQFDSADISGMISGGTFANVILHEMGHVIGIGTLWTYNNVYVDGSGQYTGAHALAQYRTEYNQPTATYIPVELGGGPGTEDGHWNEGDGGGATGIVDSQNRDMNRELMTGWMNADSYVSKTTIASLQDLGYTVNISAVPEPESALLMALGLPVLLRYARRRQQRAG